MCVWGGDGGMGRGVGGGGSGVGGGMEVGIKEAFMRSAIYLQKLPPQKKTTTKKRQRGFFLARH